MNFDFSSCGGLMQRHLDWLTSSGVPMSAIIRPEPIRCAHGYKALDGRFDHDPSGPVWLVFFEPEDIVFWQPGTDELATWHGRAFALGERVIDAASTYAFGYPLRIFANPIHWLQRNRDGIVVVDWSCAFDRLRHTPCVAVPDDLLSLYQRNMRPARLPKLFVVPEPQRNGRRLA
ncbi:hypothetical protein HJA95_02055 [Rhizobium binae]|uniref:hypothetical protein n=1 Tax=Rhizobium binae TaxID=1138190 RepID=UPI001C831F3A|nr:hypothetical protein [Rhizobium binae]MBX4948405.1 hypothetical protein [Rhizobium binae]